MSQTPQCCTEVMGSSLPEPRMTLIKDMLDTFVLGSDILHRLQFQNSRTRKHRGVFSDLNKSRVREHSEASSSFLAYISLPLSLLYSSPSPSPSLVGYGDMDPGKERNGQLYHYPPYASQKTPELVAKQRGA
eukprot:745877-Hanusia_phi.AAC.4